MNLIKKFFIFVLIALVIVISKQNLLLANEQNHQFDTSEIITNSELSNDLNLYGGVKLYQYQTTSYNDGIKEEKRLNNYDVSWLDYGNSEVRIVNVNPGTRGSWSGGMVTNLAKKYEENNPGWLIAGGINGDFFLINSTCEVMSLSMQDGELYKPSMWGALGTGAIGWQEDGTIVSGQPTISSNMYLEILDDNKIVSTFEINNVNSSLKETGINLLSADVLTTYDFTDYKVVELTYTVHRYNEANNENHDKLFVKGTVTNILTDLKETIVPYDNVYLAAKDGSLDMITKGDEIRCQYHLTGKWSKVVNSTGYFAQILKDSVSLFYQSDLNDYTNLAFDRTYMNCLKNRTVVGEKADGTTVLMTIEYDKLANKYGASYYECAEYLKSVGCVNGWLLDGGGSCSLAIRKANGDFKLVAGGSDGHERSDGNAVLIAVKDPGIRPVVKNKTRFSVEIDIEKTISKFSEYASDFSLTFNDITYPYDGKPIFIDNLKENTDYELRLNYIMTDETGKKRNAFIAQTIKTLDFPYPDIELNLVSNGSEALMFEYNIGTLTNSKVIKTLLHLDDEIYEFNDCKNVLCKNLSSNHYYNAYLTCEIYDEESGQTYTYTSDKLKTIPLTKAEIFVPYFKEQVVLSNKALIEYEVYDQSNKITSLFLIYGSQIKELNKNETKVIIDELNLKESDTTLKLIALIDGKQVELKNILINKDSNLKSEEELIPQITKFNAYKKSGINIEYQVTNHDDIEDIYILYNGKKISLNLNDESIVLKNLKLNKKNKEFELVVEYKNIFNEIKMVSLTTSLKSSCTSKSEVFIYLLTSISYLFILLRKKH